MNRDKISLKQQAEWLERLAMGRPVFVYAGEIGEATPILQGVENCAPFFRPWNGLICYSK